MRAYVWYLLAFLFSYSGSVFADDSMAPEWTRQSTRSVDNGYIVYTESETGRSVDQARLRAEGLALQDLANECTFVPKGARVEDRFDINNGTTVQSFIKIGVEFTLCEQAQKSMDPDKIKNLADQPMMEEIKKFQEQDGNPDSVLAENQTPSSDTPNSSTPYFVGGETSINQAPIPDIQGYYYERQQVAIIKQQIVLAPVNAYPVASVQYIQVSQFLWYKQQRQVYFQNQNPDWNAYPRYWSHYRQSLRAAPYRMVAMHLARRPAAARPHPLPAPRANRAGYVRRPSPHRPARHAAARPVRRRVGHKKKHR